MMFVTLSILAILATIIYYYTYSKDQNKYGHIPGPPKLPIFGNEFQLQLKDGKGVKLPLYQQITNLVRQYGDIMWIKMGFANMVIVSGYEAMQEVLVTKGADFADRANTAYRLRAVQLELMPFNMNHTPKLKATKTILYHVMRVYGENVDRLENVFHESLEDLSDKLNDQLGKPVLVVETITEAFANTMHILMLGRPLDASGDFYNSYLKIINLLRPAFYVATPYILLDKFPILRFAFKGLMRDLYLWQTKCHDFWSEVINHHKANWDGTEEQCLLDTLLKNQKDKALRKSDVQFSDADLNMILDSMFFTGFITSGNILSGMILLCALDANMQIKIYSEVSSVVGTTGRISIRHKHQLHYTRAVILEALRYISMAPLGAYPYHKTTKDTSIRGIFIPKATTVVMNQWAVHHDPDFWEEPNNYHPERFLAEDGTLVPPDHPNRKRLFAFGAGERVCVGEVFALNRLCMFLSTLVHRFEFRADDNIPLPSSDPRSWKCLDLITVPQFKVKFIART